MASAPELAVVGFVYLEVVVPEGPQPGRGEELFVDRIEVRLGGALNTASVAAALGLRVSLWHPAGQGLTDAAVAAGLARLGVKAISWPAAADPALSLVLLGGGDRSFVSAADFDSLASCPPLGEKTWIHVAGLAEAHAVALQLAKARAGGAKISVAGGWAPAELARLRRMSGQPWDLLLLNHKEAEAAAGSAEAALEELRGAAEATIVTRGESGVSARIDGSIAHVAAARVELPRDPTGAGDAFTAGLIAAELGGRSRRDSLELAGRVAARIVELGAGGVISDPEALSDLREELGA